MSLTYNKKAFLLPDSIRSAAMYHAKVFEDGTYMLRIHDCITGIRLRGDLNNNEEREEAILKLFALEEAIHELRKFLETNYKPL